MNVKGEMSMAILFVDKPNELAHSDFQSWRRANQDGYFLNCKSSSQAMLHGSLCGHHGNTEWQCPDDGSFSLTKNIKLCAASIAELEHWAQANGITVLKRCSDCAPFDRPT